VAGQIPSPRRDTPTQVSQWSNTAIVLPYKQPGDATPIPRILWAFIHARKYYRGPSMSLVKLQPSTYSPTVPDQSAKWVLSTPCTKHSVRDDFGGRPRSPSRPSMHFSAFPLFSIIIKFMFFYWTTVPMLHSGVCSIFLGSTFLAKTAGTVKYRLRVTPTSPLQTKRDIFPKACLLCRVAIRRVENAPA